jgi:hypothetical protein
VVRLVASYAAGNRSLCLPTAHTTNATAATQHRQRNLIERLSALEEAYGQQMQRLKVGVERLGTGRAGLRGCLGGWDPRVVTER